MKTDSVVWQTQLTSAVLKQRFACKCIQNKSIVCRTMFYCCIFIGSPVILYYIHMRVPNNIEYNICSTPFLFKSTYIVSKEDDNVYFSFWRLFWSIVFRIQLHLFMHKNRLENILDYVYNIETQILHYSWSDEKDALIMK